MASSRVYAQDTKVPVDQSRLELERFVVGRGATRFVSGWDQEGGSLVSWTNSDGRMVKMKLAQPKSSGSAARDDRTRRARWRALILIVKARYAAIDAGISTFEHEFLANIMLPDGSTVVDAVRPQIAEAYKSGKMQKLLPGLD